MAEFDSVGILESKDTEKLPKKAVYPTCFFEEDC